MADFPVKVGRCARFLAEKQARVGRLCARIVLSDKLLEQISQVSVEEYRENRKRIEAAEAPRRLLYRLHRNPLSTMRGLIEQHAACRVALSSTGDALSP